MKEIKVEVVCDDALADAVVRAIHRAAHTGSCCVGKRRR
jgi:nitrogen regulatory protein PII